MSRVSLTDIFWISGQRRAACPSAVSLNVLLSVRMWENAFQFQIRKQFALEKMEAGDGGVVSECDYLSDAKRCETISSNTNGFNTRAHINTHQTGSGNNISSQFN